MKNPFLNFLLRLNHTINIGAFHGLKITSLQHFFRRFAQLAEFFKPKLENFCVFTPQHGKFHTFGGLFF